MIKYHSEPYFLKNYRLMKIIKQSIVILICCFATVLNAQSPIYLEIGNCVKAMQYKSTDSEGTTSEYFDYQFSLNAYETVTLTVSKYAMENLNVDAIRSYQITNCESNALRTQLSVEVIEKIQANRQDVYLVQKTANGYKVGKANNATYSVYLPEDKYLRVIGRDFSFDFDGNVSYEPGAELKTGNGEESFIFYTQQDERCYKKPTFMHVPVNFMETANLEYILGIGMVRKYSDEMETRLISIDNQDFDAYLTAFCNETANTYRLEIPNVEPAKNEINMNLVDVPAENWTGNEDVTAKGDETFYKSTPVTRESVKENNGLSKPSLNYEYLKDSNIEVVNMGTENTAKGKNETLPQPIDDNHHVVEKGETLYAISKKYNISTLELKALNNLEDNTIEIGQQLRIKK